MEGDIGLVAGRSQREKRRSYKDLLREEEEIAAQVRKSSKKRPKVSPTPAPLAPKPGYTSQLSVRSGCRTFHAGGRLAQEEEETRRRLLLQR